MADFIDALRDPKFRSDLVSGLRDSANRGVAAFFGGPVDLATMAMRPFGYSTPDSEVIGGSEWLGKQMEQRGMVSGARNPVAEFLAAVALPAGMTKAAPGIFRAEQKAIQNAMAPQTLNKQAGMILYHGSNDSKPINEINNRGVFGGIFSSPSRASAKSHGDALYRMTVPDDAIMPTDADINYDEALKVVKSFLRDDQYADEIADMAISGRKSLFQSNIPEDDLLHAFRADSIGEADWALQGLRGKIAKSLGYRAAEMPDEHGTSYLVFPGTNPRPYNENAKKLFK